MRNRHFTVAYVVNIVSYNICENFLMFATQGPRYCHCGTFSFATRTNQVSRDLVVSQFRTKREAVFVYSMRGKSLWLSDRKWRQRKKREKNQDRMCIFPGQQAFGSAAQEPKQEKVVLIEYTIGV